MTKQFHLQKQFLYGLLSPMWLIQANLTVIMFMVFVDFVNVLYGRHLYVHIHMESEVKKLSKVYYPIEEG